MASNIPVADDASSAPLRLLVLGDASSIHTEQWVRGLAGTGRVELHLVTMNPEGVRAGIRAVDGVVAVHELYGAKVKEGGGNWRYVLRVPALRRIVALTKPDAIVAIYLSSYGVAGAAAGGPAILAHVILGSDVMTTPDRSPLYRRIARWAISRGDLLVSPSRAATARLHALADVPAEMILTQQYGLEDWILDYPILPKTFGFVSNRAWVANSQIPLVLDIYEHLVGVGGLALVGGGSAGEATIRAQALRDARVRAFGLLPHRENIEVLARSAFYISMTISDGASLSLMEAMAVGAIPVVSDIEPNREWIEAGVNGALLPLDDAPEAAARIAALAARPVDELEEVRRRNRELVRERCSRSRNMTTFRRRIEDLAAIRRRLVS